MSSTMQVPGTGDVTRCVKCGWWIGPEQWTKISTEDGELYGPMCPSCAVKEMS